MSIVSSDQLLQVIVCTDQDDIEEVRECMSRCHDLSGLQGLFKVKVPKEPPLTRKQYGEACLCWPTNFHEEKRYMFDDLLAPWFEQTCKGLAFQRLAQ